MADVCEFGLTVSKEISENVKEEWSKAAKEGYKLFWKVLVWVLKVFNKK